MEYAKSRLVALAGMLHLGKSMKAGAIFFVGALAFLLGGCGNPDHSGIKIGLNAELTGESPTVGASCKNAANLFVDQINAAGGIEVGGKKLPIQLIIGDNGDKPDQAASAAQKLITQNGVLAMVGPNVSACAIPAAEIAETQKCLMISPWSTNPKTTLNTTTGAAKQYVFRAGFTERFEAQVLAKFAIDHLKAKRAAVLYDVASEHPNTISALFRKAFEKEGGTITAFETYTTGDRDFSAQLTKIKASQPDLVFLPAYYNDVALITQQARRLGLNQQLIGSNAWSTPEIIALAGKNVEGAYFTNHYSTQIPTPIARKFMADYTAKFGQEPDDIAALTYDTFQLLAEAIRNAGKLDRQAIRDAFAKIRNYEGITGSFRFEPGSGDPVKTVMILQIQNGKFVWVTSVQP